MRQPLRCAALLARLLTELGASGHAIGERGAHALGELLARADCSLRKLSLGDANFGDAGVLALLDGLAGSPAASLEELDLEFKGLSAASAAPLGQLARALPSLRRLTLARNALGDAAAAALGGGVAASAAPLAHLDVSACDLGEAALARSAPPRAAARSARCARSARRATRRLAAEASARRRRCGFARGAAVARIALARGVRPHRGVCARAAGDRRCAATAAAAAAAALRRDWRDVAGGAADWRNAELGDAAASRLPTAAAALRTLGAAGCAFQTGVAALAASSDLVARPRLSKVGATARRSSRRRRCGRPPLDNPAIGAGAAAALVPARHGARALEARPRRVRARRAGDRRASRAPRRRDGAGARRSSSATRRPRLGAELDAARRGRRLTSRGGRQSRAMKAEI